jgi:hypothetical protein
MEVKTLSFYPGVPFNDAIESFLDAYELGEDIECYQLIFCPYGRHTSFGDLYNIEFKSRVVILNVIDFIIDGLDNIATEEIKQFCEDHPEQNFIIFNYNIGLGDKLNVPNLHWDTIFSGTLTERLTHCEKKNLTNKWLSLNADTKLHRVMAVCYLLSKDYHENGYITFNMNAGPLASHDSYRNFTKISSYQLKSSFAKGYVKFKSKDFRRLKIKNFSSIEDRVSTNYNNNLMPIYERIGVEIITGTMFFENVPSLSEKEVQSVYAKNFPIYINGIGMAREIKKLFDIDIFEDIVDHSYDEIEDHFERLAAAIDRNQHLLDGSTNIHELWYDNQKRFEDNCEKMDQIIFDSKYQQSINYKKIYNV